MVRSSYSPVAGMPRAVSSDAPEDHARAEPLVLLAVEPAVVVGEGVEIEVLDQPVEPDRDLARPTRNPPRTTESSSVNISAGERHPLGGLGIRDLIDPHPQVVELEHLDVGAERCRQQREVGRDVQHARDRGDPSARGERDAARRGRGRP